MDELLVSVESIEAKLKRKVSENNFSGIKNLYLHILIETELLESLKDEAKEKGISLGQLCRNKLID